MNMKHRKKENIFFLLFYIFILKNRIAISKIIQHFKKVISLFQDLQNLNLKFYFEIYYKR